MGRVRITFFDLSVQAIILNCRHNEYINSILYIIYQEFQNISSYILISHVCFTSIFHQKNAALLAGAAAFGLSSEVAAPSLEHPLGHPANPRHPSGDGNEPVTVATSGCLDDFKRCNKVARKQRPVWIAMNQSKTRRQVQLEAPWS